METENPLGWKWFILGTTRAQTDGFPCSQLALAAFLGDQGTLNRKSMESFYDIVQRNPELAIFLTLAIGFYVGSLKIGGFSIGSVVGVLMTGLVIGQLGVPISTAIKSVFFLFFLFAVGYAVGPQFFHGLKSEGLWQAFFAAPVSIACLLTTFL